MVTVKIRPRDGELQTFRGVEIDDGWGTQTLSLMKAGKLVAQFDKDALAYWHVDEPES